MTASFFTEQTKIDAQSCCNIVGRAALCAPICIILRQAESACPTTSDWIAQNPT